MGRKPTVNLNLPPRLRARVKAGGALWYYYDCGGKPRREIPLGNDYTTAIRRWAEFEADQPEQVSQMVTFKHVADRYVRDVLPLKAARTQRDNLGELGWLLKFFNDPPAPLESIQPSHVRKYLDWRGTKVRATREKALLTHIWNMARAWGITNLPNPCAGIKGYIGPGRDIYIEDEVLDAVWQAADVPLRDALDLAYLTGQRPADTLAMSALHIRDGVLMVEQNKTGAKLRIEITGELATLIQRMATRKANYKIHTLALVCNETGRPLTAGALKSRFDKARITAAKQHPTLSEAIRAFQFRDLRAKAGTDKAASHGMHAAQRQLGHRTMAMTEHYVRSRRGETVKPTK